MNPSDSPVELFFPLSRDNATSVGLGSTSPLRNLINKRENEFKTVLWTQVISKENKDWEQDKLTTTQTVRLGPVVRKGDNAIRGINLYPVYSV